MCGIAAWWSNDRKPKIEEIHKLALDSENRGKDGFGFCWISKKNSTVKVFRSARPFSQIMNNDLWSDFLDEDRFAIGDIFIMISRAAPETECATSWENLKDTLQPNLFTSSSTANCREAPYSLDGITVSDIYVPDMNVLVTVHNGSVSNRIINELKEKHGVQFQTKIDSEAIGRAYMLFKRDIKDTFEYLSGGFASIIYDGSKDIIYLVSDFKPLAYGNLPNKCSVVASIRSTVNDCFVQFHDEPIESVFTEMRSCYVPSGTIYKIRAGRDSVTKEEYSPRYITPFWDSNHNILAARGLTSL